MNKIFQLVPASLKEDTKAERLQEMLRIQGQNGNWNYDAYMLGMYNGLELAACILEEREVAYRNAPEKWLKDARKDNSPPQEAFSTKVL